MLTTIDIMRMLRKVPHFAGVYPVDRLPLIIKRPMSIVINLDPSYKEGSHWVVCYFEKNGYAFYFDSYGKRPTGNILTWLERFAPRGYNFSENKYQDDFSISCGYFCVLFVLLAKKRNRFFKLFQRCKTERNEKVLAKLIKLINN